MDLFDIIGPVMVGPSSSHTAGAARIGYIVRLLLGSEPVVAHIGLCGSFRKTYQGHGTDKAVLGGLMGMKVDDLRLRDSLRIAHEKGMTWNFYPASLRGEHPNTMILNVQGEDGTHISVIASSVGGGEIIIRSINGLQADFSGHENTLIISHKDTPGMIAKVSRTVADQNINVATMRLFRRSTGGEAMMVLELDGQVQQGLLDQLKQISGIDHVSYIAVDDGE